MTPLERHIDLLSSLASRKAQPADLASLMVARKEPGQRALVYRNSGIAAYTDALRSNYPRLARVVGDAFFSGLAHAYIDQHPSVSNSLVGYGEQLPGFVDAAKDEHGLHWLGDLARLDRGWLESHLSADASSVTASQFETLSGDALVSACVELHPSVRLLSVDWQIWDLWVEANTEPFELHPRTLASGKQAIVFWRPGYDVVGRLLPCAQASLLAALAQSETLGSACARALATAPGEDLSNLIADTFTAGFISKFETQTGGPA